MIATDFSQGNQLLRSNKLDEAIAFYQRAIALNPSFHWYYRKLGEALEKLERYEEAVVAYHQAVQLQPNMAWSCLDLARVLRLLGREMEAVQVEKKATQTETTLQVNSSSEGSIVVLNSGNRYKSTDFTNRIANEKLSYWSKRESHIYLFAVRQIINKIGNGATSIIDVGSNGCPYLDWFSWIPERYSLDLRKPYKAPGVISVTTDFFKYNPEKQFDLLTCLQVIEHIPNAEAFCHKLLETGRMLVVSVPYKWKAGQTKSHIHDPVDLNKMNYWFGREPNYYNIIQEVESPLQRLVCIYYTESTKKWDRVRTVFK